MILVCEMLSKLKIDLCLSNNLIRGNVGAYDGYTNPMKDMTNITVNASSVWIHEKYFGTRNYGIAVTICGIQIVY